MPGAEGAVLGLGWLTSQLGLPSVQSLDGTQVRSSPDPRLRCSRQAVLRTASGSALWII